MLTVSYKAQETTIEFAAKELQYYLEQMGLSACCSKKPEGIQLGLFHDFSLVPQGDADKDDEIAVEVEEGTGYIAGSNPRSVLFGVYRFLEFCGARWVRPGKNGTYLPPVSSLPERISLREAASKRHRGICIEGAVSLENVLDLVDWMPKLGFNSYFIQFRDAFIFFDRWYAHSGSTVKKPEPFTAERSLSYVKRIQQAVKERGMLLHMIGHGWTCEPFGVENHGWDPVKESDIPESYRAVCAQVNGTRDVWKNMPLATNLCYSNPQVRSTMVNSVVKYLKENPQVDLLHFWLGDYYNNTCECSECSKLPVSDFYVKMLNQLDEALTKEQIATKVVFLIYYDLMSPPIQEQIKNPDRFVLMFAPISRTFTQSFPKGFAIKKIPPYQINHFALPSSVEENLAFLYQWEQLFHSDTFDFDYHLMWDHILDAGGEAIAKVIYQDIQNFDSLGLNGLISCQLQRNAFPTSLAMTVMGKTLWNQQSVFSDIRRDLYAAAFGPGDELELERYFSTLSRCFDVAVLRGQKQLPKEQFVLLLKEALKTMEDFASVMNAHQEEKNACRENSWKLLSLHSKLYSLWARSLIARLEGNIQMADQLQDETSNLAWEQEDLLQPVLDCHFFDLMTRNRIQLG